MATRQPRAPRPSAPPMNGESAYVEAVQLEDEGVPAIPPPVDGLESLMAELTGAMQAKVTVYRINKQGPASYVFQCSPEAFNLDDLRNNYGGGEFRLYIVKDGTFYRNLRINVEPKQITAAPPPAPREPENPALAALEARLARQDEMIQEFYRQNSMRPERPSLLGDLDLPATITAISAAVVALRPPPPPPPAPPDTSSTDRAIDMLLKGIELAKELKGASEGDGDTSMMGMLKALIQSPMMATAVASIPGMQTPTMQGVTVARSPNAQLPPPGSFGVPQQPAQRVLPVKLGNVEGDPMPATPPTPGPAYPESMQLPQVGNPAFDTLGPFIVRYLPLLVQKAQMESSADLYAEVILDSTPEGAVDPMLEYPTSTIIDYLVQIHPPVESERPWFVALVDSMKTFLEEEGQDDPIPPDLNIGAEPSSTEG